MADRQKAAVKRVAGLGYWSAADARVVVKAWRASGEGLRVFARCYGIHPRRVRRWARELEEHGEGYRLVQGAGADRSRDERRIEIELGGGPTSYSVRVPPGFAAEDLARVLGVLAAGTAGTPC